MLYLLLELQKFDPRSNQCKLFPKPQVDVQFISQIHLVQIDNGISH